MRPLIRKRNLDRCAHRACRRAPARPPAPARVPTIGPTFASLGVPEPVITVLAEAGITSPFPIQAATLPDSLAGRDILGRGQTGSGKTLAFSIPLTEALAGGRTAAGRPRGLVLVPTRELASQVCSVLEPLAEALGLSVVTIYGGVRTAGRSRRCASAPTSWSPAPAGSPT